MRHQAIARREALRQEERARRVAAIEAHLETLLELLSPRILGFCWPYRGEPDLRDLVGRWLDGDDRRLAALPVVLGKGQPLVFRRWAPGTPMELDPHGIAQPRNSAPVLPDVVLVPLNAFDAAGYRIGYGGGYFDRTLAVLDTVAVGVGFELGRADSVFPQTHDRPMHWLVTEAGSVRTASGVDAPPAQERNIR